MKIMSFNVNGLRARVKQGFDEVVRYIDPDIMCLQETRCKEDQAWVDDEYNGVIAEHEKSGYAGCAVYFKNNIEVLDYQTIDGRICYIELEDFWLLCCYAPNSGRDLEKLGVRMKWQDDLFHLLDTLSSNNKPIIICGDLNVAPEKIDCNVFSKAGTSKEEREKFKQLTFLGYVDAYRHIHKGQNFTWFDNRYDSRAENKGMRIDHFLVSKRLIDKVRNVKIYKDDCAGSDHTPIVLELDLEDPPMQVNKNSLYNSLRKTLKGKS